MQPVEYPVGSAEPVSLKEAKKQCNLDDDFTDDDEFIGSVIIPGARGLAESLTGSAIRPARYRERLIDLECVSLSVGMVTAVEAIVVDGVDAAGADYVADLDSCRAYVSSTKYAGKQGVITYVAGTDVAIFPSVKMWLLFAIGWMYANRELITIGQGGAIEMPRSYMDAMLNPIKLPSVF